MTYNLRTSGIPPNAVIMDVSTNSLPKGYSHNASLFDVYPKGIPDVCTQPGGTLGSQNHVEACDATSHNHTGATAHTHGTVTSAAGSSGNASSPGGSPHIRDTHTHTWDPTSTSPTVTVCASAGTHTHDSQPLEPENETVRYIKKTTLGLRDSNIPPNKVIWYSKTIASLPSDFSIETGLTNNRFYKGVPDAGTDPGTQAGTNSHTHAANTTTHTHSFCLPSHGHGKPGSVNAGGGGVTTGPSASCIHSLATHVHSLSPVTLGSTSASGTTTVDDSHSHDAGLTHLPLHRELLPIKKSIISLRNRKLPTGSIVLWLCNLNTIPAGFQVADGTNGTIDTLDRHIRAVPDDTTDPGTGAGSASHQHASQTHIHTTAFVHTHTITGSLPAVGGGNAFRLASPGSVAARSTHVHTNPANTPQHIGTSLVSGSHQHASTNNDPSSLRVAYIESIT